MKKYGELRMHRETSGTEMGPLVDGESDTTIEYETAAEIEVDNMDNKDELEIQQGEIEVKGEEG